MPEGLRPSRPLAHHATFPRLRGQAVREFSVSITGIKGSGAAVRWRRAATRAERTMTTVWIFVVSPPRERPMQRSGPPLMWTSVNPPIPLTFLLALPALCGRKPASGHGKPPRRRLRRVTRRAGAQRRSREAA